MEYIRFILSFVISLLCNRWKSPKKIRFLNILVIRLDHLGDTIWSLEALQQLRMSHPNAKITLLIGEWNVDLFENCEYVDQIIIYNSPEFTRDQEKVSSYQEKCQLKKKLQKQKFDLIVGFRDDFFTLLSSLMIWPKFRVDRGSVRIKKKIKNLFSPQLEHEYYTNMAIIKNVSLFIKPIAPLVKFREQEERWLNDYLMTHELFQNGYVIIHPGASWKYRRWSVDKFRQVAMYLMKKYHLKSIVIGNKDEEEIGALLTKGGNDTFINMVGRTTLREMMVMIAKAKLFIGNDSGPMHLAAMMDVPTLALLGPQSISRFGPRGKYVVYLHKKLECHPCHQDVCKYPNHPCVELNTVDEAILGIDLLLSKSF